MATPVLACGFECGVAGPAAAGAHHLSVASGSPTFDTTTVRTGLRSLRCNPSATVVTLGVYGAFGGAGTVIVGRAYVRFASLPSADTALLAWSSSTGASVRFKQSDSKLYAAVSTTFGATGVSVTTGQWYRLDFKWDDTNNTSDLQVDGTACGQATLAFSPGGGFFVVGVVNSTTADVYFDDLLVSATSGDYPLGAGFVKSYIPNADGTHNVAGANDFERTLTGTDITNATTDAYTLIDERPLPTTAVDFINGSAPPNSTDYVEWQYEDSTESNAPRAVEAVIVHHDASGAGTNNFTVTLREHAGGTSGDIWTGTTNVGATITYKRAHFATVPGTSDAWTTTKFNALRSRFLVTDHSPDPYLDAIILEVEFPETGAAIERTATDSFTFSDSAGRVVTLLRSPTDALTFSDAAARTATLLRSIADALTHSEAAARAVTAPRTAADALTHAETAERTGTFNRDVADSLTNADEATRTGTFNRAASDSLTFSDIAEAVRVILRSAVDALTFSDTATRITTALRAASDSLTHSEVATRTGTFLRDGADALTHSETATRVASLARSVADSLDFSDAATRITTALRSAADNLTHSDTATRIGTFLRAATDNWTFSEVAEAIRQGTLKTAEAIDSLIFSDAATRTVTLLRSAADNLTHSDAATRIGTFLRSPADALTFSDTATRAKTAVRTAIDSLTFSDTATRVVSLFRVAADALTYAEDAAASKIGAGITWVGWFFSRGGWH